MTSLLQAPSLLGRADRDGSATPPSRPLALVAVVGGLVAAAVPLLVCMAVGVIGWFLSDAGIHGSTRDGLRAGALAWLMGHGAGVTVRGASVTLTPLLLTAAAGWSMWRCGLRVGDRVSSHGPDADRISDGERDWTVPAAVVLFTTAYAVVAAVTVTLAAQTTPSFGRAVACILALALAVVAPAVAIGSGRAAIWSQFVPSTVSGGLAACRSVLVAFLGASTVLFLVALALGFGEAASMVSRLHLHAGETLLFGLVCLAFLPNAVVFGGSWLLGPGFSVGAGTSVSPALVVLGPLPLFPPLAALPAAGETSTLAVSAIAVPPVLAAVAVAHAQRRRPTLRWDEGALRGCGGGIAAGVVLGVLASMAGGAAGPGRMQQVGPSAFDVLVHAITAFGLGGLVGGLAMTWWQRRAARRAAA